MTVFYPEDVWEGPGIRGSFIRVAPIRRWYMNAKLTLRFGLPRMCIARIGDAYLTVLYSQAVESLGSIEGLDDELFVAMFRTYTTDDCLSLLPSLFCD